MSMSENGREATTGPNKNGVAAPLYEVRGSPIHGRGVFAARYIRKGTKILEYKGERIGNREADRRYDDARMKRHHTFLFTLDKTTCIDGSISAGGGDASYINHSCDPNCEAIITGKRIFIHALRGIEPGAELAYDYQYERTGKNDDELEKFYICKCGSANCRGTIMKPEPPKRRRRGNRSREKTSR